LTFNYLLDGPGSPKRIDQVQQNTGAAKRAERKTLSSANSVFLELGNYQKNRMAKAIASQLPLRDKKLNRLLSINYLKLMSSLRPGIYVTPYFATRFHRMPDASLALKNKELETAPLWQRFQLPHLARNYL
jgi:hypothetical protein